MKKMSWEIYNFKKAETQILFQYVKICKSSLDTEMGVDLGQNL